jgi:hypothetical protein
MLLQVLVEKTQKSYLMKTMKTSINYSTEP